MYFFSSDSKAMLTVGPRHTWAVHCLSNYLTTMAIFLVIVPVNFSAHYILPCDFVPDFCCRISV
jgi:hypothetical protein